LKDADIEVAFPQSDGCGMGGGFLGERLD